MLNTLAAGLLNNFTSTGEWLASLGKKNAIDFCSLETADDEFSFVAHDGSLMTILRIDGINCLPGKDEAVAVFERMSQSVQAYISNPGHMIQAVFMRDAEIVKDDLQEYLQPSANTAERLGMDMTDVLDERRDNLARYTAHEETLLVLWTTPGALTKAENERQRIQQRNFFHSGKAASIEEAQYVAAVVPALRDKHKSFVDALMDDLEVSMLSITKMDVHTAGRLMRRSFDPDFTDGGWTPILPGDRFMKRRLKGLPKGDLSEIMWPPLGPQLVARDVVTQGISRCKVGKRIYQPMYMDVFPKDGAAFMTLFRRMHRSVPWRISFLIGSDGLGSMGVKTTLATFLSFASLNNKLINAAKEELEDRYRHGEINVKLQVAFTTWANNEEVLNERSSILARAIQGWGDSTPREVTGDTCAGLFSTLPGMSQDSIGNIAAAPISEAVQMLPLLRPMLPWSAGAILFRSTDGRPMPYQPGSGMQTHWIDLYFAKPGSGKSVTMNAVNLAYCLAPGISRLPRIGIIEVAPSSKGLVSLLQEALPEDQRHLAVYHKLRMTDKECINPFDTQLGCRQPTPLERAFMVNFLTLLATPISKPHAYDGVPEMCGALIDETFRRLDNDGNNTTPHIFSPGICPEVDELLPSLDIVVDRRTTWWEIVDALFRAKQIRPAMLAQRYAVPLVADIVQTCGDDSIRSIFGKKIIEGETLIEAMQRMLQSAVREYPVLSRPTAFDLGEARIVSLDLNDVAKSGGDNADRQTAVMYMLARHVVANKFFLLPEDVNGMPELYRPYHRVEIGNIREDVKRLCFDEFHKTEKARAVREQVISDMREGRKWGIHIALASQLLADFDKAMLENATNVYIMGTGQNSGVEEVVSTFGLNNSARNALVRAVHGPRADGVTFLAKFSTKHGDNIQLLNLTLGPIELWALDTTVENDILRQKLYDRLGPRVARRLLARRFPGTAKDEIDRRKISLKNSGELTDAAELGVIDQVFNELMEEYSRNPERYQSH